MKRLLKDLVAKNLVIYLPRVIFIEDRRIASRPVVDERRQHREWIISSQVIYLALLTVSIFIGVSPLA